MLYETIGCFIQTEGSISEERLSLWAKLNFFFVFFFYKYYH